MLGPWSLCIVGLLLVGLVGLALQLLLVRQLAIALLVWQLPVGLLLLLVWRLPIAWLLLLVWLLAISWIWGRRLLQISRRWGLLLRGRLPCCTGRKLLLQLGRLLLLLLGGGRAIGGRGPCVLLLARRCTSSSCCCTCSGSPSQLRLLLLLLLFVRLSLGLSLLLRSQGFGGDAVGPQQSHLHRPQPVRQNLRLPVPRVHGNGPGALRGALQVGRVPWWRGPPGPYRRPASRGRARGTMVPASLPTRPSCCMVYCDPTPAHADGLGLQGQVPRGCRCPPLPLQPLQQRGVWHARACRRVGEGHRAPWPQRVRDHLPPSPQLGSLLHRLRMLLLPPPLGRFLSGWAVDQRVCDSCHGGLDHADHPLAHLLPKHVQ